MMSKKWYVLHSQPRREEVLYRYVLSLGYDCFFPCIKVHPVNPRSHKLKAYFPGYIFVYIDLASIGDSVFKWMQHSTGLVSFGGEPAIISDAIISSLKTHLSKINNLEDVTAGNFTHGDQVEIQSDVFKGYEAIFDHHLPGSQRVRILLRMLTQDRAVPIVLPDHMIKLKYKRLM